MTTFANQADLLTEGPKLIYLNCTFDCEGYERTERVNGAMQCPRCGLWWPCIEEPDCWTEDELGRWIAVEWWGGVVCGCCHLLMVDQPDGRSEAYQL